MSERKLRMVVSALLAVAAGLFAVGVAIERHDVRSETSSGSHAFVPRVLLLADADQGLESGVGGSSPSSRTTATHGHRHPKRSGGETPAEKSHEHGKEKRHETPAQRAREGGSEHGHETPSQLASERGGEQIFGINPDSTALVVIAVVVSLALAITIWLLPGIWPIVLVILFAAGAAVFDAREIAHQVNESRTNLVVIASIVTLLHLAAACSGLLLLRHRRLSPAGRLASG